MSYYSPITRDVIGEETKDYRTYSHQELLKTLSFTFSRITEDQRAVEGLQRSLCRYYARSYAVNQEFHRRAAKREQLQKEEVGKIVEKEQELAKKVSESPERKRRPRSPSSTPPRTPLEVVDVEEVKTAPPKKAKKEEILPEGSILDKKSKKLAEKKSKRAISDDSDPAETADAKKETKNVEEDLEKAERDLKKSLEESAPAGEVCDETPISPVPKTAPKAPLPLVPSAETGGLVIPDALQKKLEEGKKLITSKIGRKSLTIEEFAKISKFLKLKEAQETTEVKLAKETWPQLFEPDQE